MPLVYMTFQVVLFLLMVFFMGGATSLQLYKVFYGEPSGVAGSWGAIFVLTCFSMYFGYQTYLVSAKLAFYLNQVKERKSTDAH